ncbi:MAG: PorV/PorQ family protein [Candidatus Zixiibacteriota bacterium]
MKPSKLLTGLIALLMVMAMVSETYADISNAAVLYLRIAPGARAAAMGEAYVAIADDATATHWNPAGLGSYPLSPSWKEADIPASFQPITAVAALKTRGGNNYAAYDVWAITAKGLARYDNKKWYEYELFETRTDQTVEKIVGSYFNITDQTRIEAVAKRVAVANNKKDYAWLEELIGKINAGIPENYGLKKSLAESLDTLLAGYDRCLINWDAVFDAEKKYNEGMEDGSISEGEMDKITFAIDKARTRFIPEELVIMYSAYFDGEPTALASAGGNLLVGTDKGLYSFNGRDWIRFNEQNGLPSLNITAISASGSDFYIGTDKGVVKSDGFEIMSLGEGEGLPEGPVSALSFAGNGEIWAVVKSHLYHFNGTNWSGTRDYTVVLDDSVEKIARKLALYGSDKEKERLVNLIQSLNRPAADATDSAGTPAELLLEPGQTIRVPFSAGFKGQVNDIYVEPSGRVWFATTYGVIYYENSEWVMPGYREYTVSELGQNLADILSSGGSVPMDAEGYKATVMDINDLESESLRAGKTIRLYRNPTAAPVRSISARGGHTYFATSLGLVEYDGVSWSKVDLESLDKASMVKVETQDDELWFAGSSRIVSKANARTDISAMYVKWLPELADDLYYTFFSAVSHKEGWGTFGGNFTLISYGTITRTGEQGQDLGTFDSYDMALTGSYGTSLTKKLKGGISAKFLYSRLADQGAGTEQGEGTASGFAIDMGLLYHWSSRLSLGLAVTNLGPDMAYIDAAQSDPLPRNFAVGVAYKLLESDYYHLLLTSEVNKSLVGVDDSFREELKQLVLNGGAEFLYANLLALRGGYIFDEEGDIKTATVGVGLGPVGIFKFDFSYIPSNSDVALANTLRVSLAIQP